MGSKLLMLVAAGLAGVICWSGGAAEAQISASRIRGECIKERARSQIESIGRGDPLLRDVAETCRSVGAGERGLRSARAHFYAGRAYNMLGDAPNAISQLEIAVNLGRDFRDFSADLRAAKLELVQAYRTDGRREPAQRLLGELGTGDPAAAFQSAMLTLSDFGEAGKQDAFDALKRYFVQTDAQLRTSFGLSDAEIRRGRAWLYWLGMDLGGRVPRSARDPAQRAADAQRAIDYYSAAVGAVSAASSSIDATDNVSGIGGGSAPSNQDLARAFFELGAANLRAAGVSDDVGLSAIGQSGQLDCLGGRRSGGAANYVRNAMDAYNSIKTRYASNVEAQADANWGLGCAILANLSNARDATDQRTQLAQAVSALRQVNVRRPDVQLTLARALAMQGGGQMDAARTTFRDALACLPVTQQDLAAASGCANQPTAESLRSETTRTRVREFRSRIFVEMARTYFQASDTRGMVADTSTSLFQRAIVQVREADPATLNAAVPNLNAALTEDATNPEANLLLGHIKVLRRQFSDADNQLRRFRDVGNQAEGAAEGAFLLSQRLVLEEQDRLEPRQRSGSPRGGADAVNFATRAYNIDPTNQEYRQQACMARMVFGFVADGQYCAADRLRDGERFAEALLFEGMFYLRHGQAQNSRAARMASWSRSIQRFEAGYTEGPSDAMVEPEHVNLQDLLHYGERYVRRCTGLGLSDPERASEEVRKFFRRAGMPDPCG